MRVRTRTQRITMIAMLSALAFVVMAVGRIPIMSIPGLTLKYDPKDVIIIIGGYLYGPLAAASISALVSLIEMVTVSENGPVGFLMNIVSSCSFACVAALIYKYRRTLSGAVTGLTAGVIFTAFAMVLWNYFVTPLYLGIPRAAVAPHLFTFFLPFNLIKGGINAALTMLIYKPFARVLRSMTGTGESESGPEKKSTALVAAAVGIIAVCVVFIIFVVN